MKIRWLLDNQACTSAYQADRRRLEEQVYPLQFEALRFQRTITQDELGIVCAEEGKSLKTENTVEFLCLSQFISWHSAICCCAYPDIVNAIICFFLLLHASPYLCMNEGIWVCVRERDKKSKKHFSISGPVWTFRGTMVYFYFHYKYCSVNWQEFGWLFIGLQLQGSNTIPPPAGKSSPQIILR